MILEQPVSTYLVAFYVGEYIHEQTESSSGIPIHYFTFEDRALDTAVDWENTPDILEFFSRITPYGFDLYQNTLAPFAGGMEHQTNSMMGEAVTRGDKRFEWVLAHEIAHQWWGDLVTLASWNHMWLNEGFATYFDLMYTEYKYGVEEFEKRLVQTADGYFLLDSLRTARGLPRNAILSMPSDRLFTTDVYNKGALILHMLRGLFWMQEAPQGLFSSEEYRAAQSAGDARFLKIFDKYALRHKYANAVSADFQAASEEVLGAGLDWFFHQWLEEPGYPSCSIKSSAMHPRTAAPPAWSFIWSRPKPKHRCLDCLSTRPTPPVPILCTLCTGWSPPQAALLRHYRGALGRCTWILETGI